MSTNCPGGQHGNPLDRSLFVAGTGSASRYLIDTSTLIYLDRIAVLSLALFVFSPSTVPQVIEEFGRHPEGLLLCESGCGETDVLLVQAAVDMQAAVLSEDKKLLMAARRQGLCYYNSLMIVLALYSRGEVSRIRCKQLLVHLQSFAHYSEKVWGYGQQQFERLVQQDND